MNGGEKGMDRRVISVLPRPPNQWVCSSVGGLQQDFACCQCRVCRKLSLFVFLLFFTSSHTFIPLQQSLQFLGYSSSLFNMIPVSCSLSLSLSLCISFLHWLAGSLFINLMQFAQSFSSLLQQSCSVKLLGSLQPAKLSLTGIPQKTNLQFPNLNMNSKKFKMFLLSACVHPPLFLSTESRWLSPFLFFFVLFCFFLHLFALSPLS